MIKFNSPTQLKWENVALPSNLGFLKRTSSDRSERWLDVAVFHQLRCVIAIRGELTRLIVDEKRASVWMQNEGLRDAVGECLDLVRQAILCNSDATTEPFDDRGFATLGFGVSHECKDISDLITEAKRSGLPPTELIKPRFDMWETMNT